MVVCRRSPATPGMAGGATPGPESELERKARELQAKQQTLMAVSQCSRRGVVPQLGFCPAAVSK
jgi:hypothetical protein